MSGGFDFMNRISNWFSTEQPYTRTSGTTWFPEVWQWSDCFWPPTPNVKPIKIEPIKIKGLSFSDVFIDDCQWLSDGVSCKPIENKPITSSQEFIDITDKQDELRDLIQSGRDIAEEIKTLSESIEEGIQKLVDKSVEKFQEASVNDKVKDSNLKEGWYEIVSVKDSNGNEMLPNPKESTVKEESYPELRKVLKEYNERQKAKETRFDKTEGNIISYKTTQEDVEKAIKRMDDTMLKLCIGSELIEKEVPKQEVEIGLEIPSIRSTNERISGITHKEYKTIDDIFEDIEEDIANNLEKNEDYQEIERHRSEINSRKERIEELKKSVVQKWLGSGDSDTVKFDKEIEDLTGKSDTVKMFEQAFKYSLPNDNKVSNVIHEPKQSITLDELRSSSVYQKGLEEMPVGTTFSVDLGKHPKSERDRNGGQNNEGDLIDNSTPEHKWISCKELMPDKKKIVEVKITDKLTGYTKQVKRNIRFQQMHDTCNFQYIRDNAITDGYSFVRDMFWRPLANESLEDCLPDNLKFQVGDLVAGYNVSTNDYRIAILTEIDYDPNFVSEENKSIPFTIDTEYHWFDPRKSFKITPEDLPKIQEILEA